MTTPFANGATLLGQRLQKLGQPVNLDDGARNADVLAARRSFNRVRNGNFSVNQRARTGTVTLAAGVYGHDGWKAGAGGCTYTFSSAASGDTVLTITAGTLLQIIEGSLVPEGGAYVLSWANTAQARIYQGAATGAYASSPLAVSGLAAGSNTAIEFGTGTLSLARFEFGTVATAFEPRDDELRRCQRYLQPFRIGETSYQPIASSTRRYGENLAVAMRANPTVASTVSSGTDNCSYSFEVLEADYVQVNVAGVNAGYTSVFAKVLLSAEL